MCEPVSLISGGLGVMQAVGGANAQQQQANAQYAANKAQRQQQINNQRSKLTLDTARFHRRQTDRDAADIEAGRAANDAYLGNQTKYNEKIKSFMVNKQNRLIKSMELAGVAGARGQRGGSITAMNNSIDAATGRDTATALAGLRSSASQLISGNRDIQGKLQGEYFSNYSQIGDEPTQGFTPPEAVKPAGPSPLSIAANIGQATLGAFSAGQAANTLPNGQTMDMLGGGFNPSASSFTGNTASSFNLGNTLW
tara:strand:+ start:252 stop:1010 length:759 start_codon:yes stop_codon:yes gene_type:complete